jgi:hypothetical protein
MFNLPVLFDSLVIFKDKSNYKIQFSTKTSFDKSHLIYIKKVDIARILKVSFTILELTECGLELL